MAEDIIDHYIDRDGIRQDTAVIVAELNKVYELIKRIRESKVSVGDAAGFSATSKAAQEAKKNIDDLTAAQERLTKIEIEAEKVKQAKLRTQQAQIKADSDVVKQIQLEERAEQQNIKTKKEKLTYEQAIQREKSKGASQAAAETKIAEQLTNEYYQLGKALKDAELRYKNLYLTGQGQTKAANEALQQALSIRKVLDGVDQKLGNFQRNVGNYASGFSGLNTSVQQILREAPSAAVSLNTFFLAISNNLPIFFDEIQKAKKAIDETNIAIKEAAILAKTDAEAKALQAGATTEAAAAEGVLAEKTALANAVQTKAPGILSQIGKSLFSVQSALTAGVLVLTLFGGKIIDWIGSLFKAEKATFSLADKTKLLNDVMADANKQAGKELADLEIIYKATQNLTLSQNERIKSAKYLQDIYPQTFKNFTKEEILLGKAKDGYNDLTAAILKNALAASARVQLEQLGAQKLAAEFQKQKIKNATDNEKAAVKERNLGNGGGGGSSLTGGGVVTNDVIITVAEQKAVIDERRNKALAIQDNILKSIAAKEKFLIDFVGASNIVDTIVDKPKNDNKTPTTKESTKAVLDSDFELYKIAQERKKKLLLDGLNNESEDYDKRIALLQDFSNASLELINKQEESEKKVLLDKLSAQQENLKKSKGTERNNLITEIKNTNTQIKIIEAKSNDERLNVYDEHNKKFDEITKQHDEKIKKAKQQLYNDLQEYAKKYNSDIELKLEQEKFAKIKKLDKDFSDGRIKSVKEYKDKKAKIEEDYAKREIKLDLDVQNLLLDLATANGVSEVEIQKKINDLLKKEYEIDADNFLKSQETKEEIAKNKSAARQQLEDEVQNATVSFFDGQFEREKNRVQESIDLAEKEKNDKIKAINELFISDKEKSEKIAVVEAVAQAKREQLEKRQKEIDYRKAIFDRGVAIFDVVKDTARAIAAHNAALQPYLIPYDIALGAAQVAAILSRPIPKFKHGKNNDYEGAAIVDDGGRNEPIYRADTGQIELSTGAPKDRITFLKRKDIVFPSIEAMMNRIVLPKLVPIKDNAGPIHDMQGVINAINSINIKTTTITKEGWREHAMKLEQYNDWVNKTIKN